MIYQFATVLPLNLGLVDLRKLLSSATEKQKSKKRLKKKSKKAEHKETEQLKI